MGGKPSTAASAVAAEPAPSGSDSTSTNGRFGMPAAVVITVCIVTAAVLVQLGMIVSDALFLLAGAGSIGAAVVVLAVTGGHRAGPIGRLVRAYFSAGN
ncbi:hypothetical protein [Streptomyces sp. NBC_01518]|uniref:hypothetical protein n=1 Tax=Streptomyces sp. NBC_01518 TaxID=2903891 RepID=UPI00386E90A3